MKRVLIVDDSPVARELLAHILTSDPEISVVASVDNGEDALRAVERLSPDVITMDIMMPNMDGLEATRRIMEAQPTPIVIVSAAWDPKESERTFRAMDAGAVAILEKPRGLAHPEHDDTARELVQTVKAMSEIKVVTRLSKWRRAQPAPIAPPQAQHHHPAQNAKLVAIGASTGGPVVLETVLSGLPEGFAAPLLVVQHIAPGFLPGLTEWLSQTTGLPVHVPTHGERPLPGHVYFAPDGYHMGVQRNGHIAVTKDPPENRLRPSVSYLFRSVADVLGRNAVGVLLTGMGKDGAAELKLMKEKGAVTIAQDEESSVVHGMPGEAVKLGAAQHVLSPDRIPALLQSLACQNSHQSPSRPNRREDP